MISIDEMQEILEELAEEVPEEFFQELNGGILLLPEKKRHPESCGDDLYIMGEYHHDQAMGRYIVIYYGSFRELYRDLTAAQLKAELRETLFHEFTHHIESLAGEYGLEIKDEMELEDYRNENRDG